MTDANPWTVVAKVAEVLDHLAVRCSVGGSLAGSIVGEPGCTSNADLIAELRPEHIDSFIEQLSPRFYIPAERLRRAVREYLSANLIDQDTGMKVDVFIAGGTPLDDAALTRRLPFAPRAGAGILYVHTPEDVLLQKLRWYRKGGEVSDRQWRDIVGILRVQGSRLDRSYLAYGAALLGVTDLLDRVLAQE
jgi:hypothetical protein